ncbi:MAG TPA: methyltransferase domain-containing protein [Anaerolineales bacterium]
MADPNPSSRGNEEYLHGYSPEHRAFLSSRTAARDAAFFLPYLKPGMRLLDCGCGMGALTTSLAEWLAPGEVIGLDREGSQIEAAQAWATEKGVGNVQFEAGDIYNIAYPDASFDAVFANTVLEHLREPKRAMREMRRVLKPGGVAGLSDPDYEAQLHAPDSASFAEAWKLMRAFSAEHASPYYARHQREYLLEAGFARTEGFSRAVGGGNSEQLPFIFNVLIRPTVEAIRPWVVEKGLADDRHVDEILADVEAWSSRPDAFFAMILCQAVAWAA